ncbi:diacylglycerol kinase family protein [Paracoccus sp. P2]|uniref:Diacylglycerol kinase n=1 Tax=Paracoccus pantotrophus TaxID=82367 RepID=A0A7H9BX56_PARPN|nr:diacylglycerol kinase family protein [Paracoccus pantotrophus]MDF3854673.1 diacylglycerol kinase family protein [Paracoccus pantotrophus]QLH15722.1 diacylglycerol kinase [Paracoccus pantotrophus]RDD94325.1 diacylglycerol kinase [Paracoccus pantotrophus]RNI19742.1 diacylglycerol kinase [Paracoccus pantotrophus]WGR63925.1 diacylglycerol kinase [Paracoccus pantotrophus]
MNRQDDPAEGPDFDLAAARVCAIVNMGSGREAGDDIADKLRRALQGRVAELQFRGTGQGADLPAMARAAVAEGFDLIVAAGGDGTQAAVAGAIAGTEAAMAVIPGGTFNYFARDLGSGETVDAALAIFDAPRIRRVHVGEMNGMVFLNNVSFGAYPEILRRRESIYRRWGRSRLAAYWSAVAALWTLRRPLRLTVHADGKTRHFTTALAFVAKSAYQLDAFGLEGADCVRRGQLALLVARAKRPGPLVRSALRLALGKSARYADFDLICADDFELETVPRHEYVAHDGEKTWMDSPFRIRVRHDALKVLVPAESGGRDAG